MNQFVGKIEAKLDSKNRVFVPASFRKMLLSDVPTSVILRRDMFQPCLVVYPEDVWAEEIATLKQKLNKWDKTQQQLLRQYANDSEKIELDNSGRILMPKRYLEILGSSSDLTFLGVDNIIEIWNTQTLEESLLSQDVFSQMLENVMLEK